MSDGGVAPITTALFDKCALDKSIMIDGKDFKLVSIVGIVTDVNKSSQRMLVTVTDEFGSLTAQIYLSGLEPWILEKYSAIEQNSIIRLTGDIKTEKEHGKYFSITQVQSASLDSLHCHYLEVIKFRADNGKLTVNRPAATTSNPASSVKPELTSQSNPFLNSSAPTAADTPIVSGSNTAQVSGGIISSRAQSCEDPTNRTIIQIVEEIGPISPEDLFSKLTERMPDITINLEQLVSRLNEESELYSNIFESDGLYSL